MYTFCQICKTDIHERDGDWLHVANEENHEAKPIHADGWPTDDVVGPFRDEYEFLSNFHWVEVEYDGITFPTSEHAYQAMKSTDDPELYERIASTGSPSEAKDLARQATLPDDWDDCKKYIMLEVVTAKFGQNPDLEKKLLDTGNRTIVELNWWGDTYWGAEIDTGEGQNVLGRILMHVRSTLRSL